jgi:hypothetical protein
MTKKKVAVILIALFFTLQSAGVLLAAMGKIDSFSYTGRAADVVGDGTVGADSKGDAEFALALSGTASVISAISLKNLTTNQEWSTGSAANVLGVADSKGSVINGDFPGVAFLLKTSYQLYVNDAAALLAKGGEFEATVTFVDRSTATSRTTVAAKAAEGGAAAATPGGAGNAKLVSAEFKGVGGYDLSDGTKKLNSNMSPDYRFDIRLSGTDTLTGVRIRTISGTPERVWDTAPTTNNGLVVVTEGGKGTPLNQGDGSLQLPLADTRDLNFWIDGADDTAKRDFRLTLLFAGGRIAEVDLKQTGSGAPAAQPNQQQGANQNARGGGSRGRGGERSAEMSAKPVQIKLDVVGKNRVKKASGVKDFSLVIKVRGRGRIEAISLVNQAGDGMWDTVAGSKAWLMIVRKNNTQANDPKDMSVSIPVSGNDTLELLIEDNGSLTKKNTRFLLAVTWDDGEITEEILSW